MKKIFMALTALSALTMGACTNAQISAMQAGQIIANAQIPASDILAAANAWDVIVAGAAQYRVYCKVNSYPQPVCSKVNRIAVIKWTKAGRTARDKLEDVLDSGAPVGPVALYQTLITAYQALNATQAANFVTPAAPAAKQ